MSAATPKFTRRAILALGGGSTLALGLPGLAFGAPATRTMQGSAFATEWSVTVPDSVDIEGLRMPIEAMLAGIDLEMSPWRADSAISRFNAAPAGTMKMPADTLVVTDVSLQLARQSGGEFDPTVGPLVSRWGFGPIKGGDATDWQHITIEEDAVGKANDGLTLDLCGIAKGYALDCMSRIVAEAGHDDFLIDLGGELGSSGAHPSGRPWRAAIEDPRPGFDGAVEVLNLEGLSVATSGSRANGYEVGARRYSHIIDPLTGEPVDTNLLSVSVLGPNAFHADGWATALFAAGATRGPALAAKAGIDALFVLSAPDGLQRIPTGSFSDYLA